VRVLVSFATESEFGPWRRLRAFRPTAADAAVYEAQIGENQVVVVVTGIGAGNARASIGRLLESAPDCCVSSGLAGGLKPDLSAGEVLAARAVRATDSSRLLDSDAELVATALVRAQDKAEMGLAADVVEMESFGVMDEATDRGIPAVAIRAVSDPVSLDLPLDFNRVVDDLGTVRVPLLLGQLARNPQRLPALARFGWESSRAARSLAEFLDRFVKQLSRPSPQPLSFAEIEKR
jgi:nucleoside phosphorylase